MIRFILLTLPPLLWLSVAVALTPFKATYDIAFGVVSLGQADMIFQPTGQSQYQLGFHAKTTGFTALFYPYSLTERSTLERLPNQTLRSTGYFYQEKKENVVQKQYNVRINYDQKTIKSTSHKGNREWSLNTSFATDKLSFAFIIGDELNQRKALRSPITIVDGKRIRYVPIKELNKPPRQTNQFNNQQDAPTPLQTEDYTQYRRFYLEDDGESIEIWLAKKQRHIPYKILFTSDGWTLYYELKSMSWSQ